LKSAPSSEKFWNSILFWSHRAQREMLIKNVFVSIGSEQWKCLFLSVEISATWWKVLELNFILIASCSAWNSDQEYILDCMFLSRRRGFSKYWNQRHLVASFGIKFSFDHIVLSVKFWSRMCLFQLVLSSRSAFF
jgi:hypothetical protein